MILIVLILLAAVVAVAASGIRVVQQYERGVVFRLGRVRPALREPGLAMIVPVIDRLHKVNLQIVTLPVPAQEGITRDNVTVKVDAVVYFNVCDPVQAIVRVAGLQVRGRAGRADLPTLHHRQERTRRPAVQSGATQPGPGTDDRQSRAGLGQSTSTE